MSNALDQVRDLDAVKSLRPLAFGLTGRFVSGVAAVLRRVLCVWHRAGLLELEGATLSAPDRASLARQMERRAEDLNFIASCDVVAAQDEASGDLTIAARVRFIDGRTYQLEVAASAAGPVLVKLGGQPA